MSGFADAFFERINRYHMADWLQETMLKLGRPMPNPALQPGAFSRSDRSWGLILTFGRVGTPLDNWQDEIILVSAEGDSTSPMPFGLDPINETPASATMKLSDNIAGPGDARGDADERRISFFMEGGRLIELRFNEGMIGFDRIIMARLGEPQEWQPA
ncbi:hypothetical protein [Agrobacterium vitis]|uniref:hypothetical protein n=1 Tax=Agrobacterium vitis TaxID=373 RepID=UPI0015737AB4|nr:hypothetical protein [Agrobacterium vitis]NSZ19865.1 hypothetical protein [Agrobacterium vitis]QZO07230.1 hypothetical protein K4831_24550 [Agrobacterium vitis]UJL91135.1 hypothetical protein AVF2S5_24470 [Agrobacterium vitis]